jgi:NADH:ubiquinone oxidoreductase subunit 6 (subunit J)
MPMITVRNCAIAIVDGLLTASILVSPLIWVSRDGLGPDATDSAGITALAKAFMTFYWGPVTVALIILSIVVHFGLHVDRNSQRSAPPKGSSS